MIENKMSQLSNYHEVSKEKQNSPKDELKEKGIDISRIKDGTTLSDKNLNSIIQITKGIDDWRDNPNQWKLRLQYILETQVIDDNLIWTLQTIFWNSINQYEFDDIGEILDSINKQNTKNIKETQEKQLLHEAQKFNAIEEQQVSIREQIESENIQLLSQRIDEQLSAKKGDEYASAIEQTKQELPAWWEEQLPVWFTPKNFLVLYTVQQHKAQFEDVLDTETRNQLEAIKLPYIGYEKTKKKQTLNIWELNSKYIVTSISSEIPQKEVENTVGTIDSYSLSLGNEILSGFSNIVLQDWTSASIDTSKANEITKAIGLRGKEAEQFIKGLFLHQIKDTLPKEQIEKHQTLINQSVQVVISQLHQQSIKNTLESSVSSYTNVLTEAMGKLGDDFQTNSTDIKYIDWVGLSVPISIQGVQLPDPIIFDKTISWPSLTIGTDNTSTSPAQYHANHPYSTNALSVQDFITKASVNPKNIIQELRDNPNSNPITMFWELEQQQIQKNHASLNKNQDTLSLQLGRQLWKLKLSTNALKFGNFNPNTTSESTGNTTSNILQNLDENIIDVHSNPDSYAVLKTITTTSSYLSSSEMDKLWDTLQRFTTQLASNHNQNNKIQDVLVQNIYNSNNEQPLYTTLTPFMKNTVDNKKIIDIDALETYVDYLESPTSKTMHFMDYLHEQKLNAPTPEVHKNFITNYNKVFDIIEKQDVEPYLDEALKNID